MGDLLKPLAFLGLAIFAPFLAPVLVTAGVATATVAIAVNALIAVGALGALSSTLSLLQPGPRLTPFDPRGINPDVAAPRKLVLGATTMVLDLRYYEPSGKDDEFIDYIFALAAHRIHGVESIHIDDKLAWTPGGGAQGEFNGYLTIEVITEAGPSAFHTVNSGSRWGSTTRLTGCATMKVRVKRSNNSKSSASPFSGGFGGRITVTGSGMPVYDPRLDSTVPGGSGSHRADNPATWAFTAGGVDIGRNPVLQVLAVLIGWRINGKVSVGAGLPLARLPLEKFAAAASICDEMVGTLDGGIERRYRHDRPFADTDDPMAVIEAILQSCNGELVDDGGKLYPRVAVNDLVPTTMI